MKRHEGKEVNMMKGIIGMMVFVLALFLLAIWNEPVFAQFGGDQPPAEEVTPDQWPRTATIGGATYSGYQPQLDSWDDYHFEGHAAVSVLPAGAKNPDFGVIEITAKTHVHRLFRTVDFKDINISKATFPSASDKATAYQQALQTMVSGGPSSMSLDRFKAMLGIASAEKQARSVPVKNEAPKFLFSHRQQLSPFPLTETRSGSLCRAPRWSG